jgi:hypothetical protein
MMLVSTNQKAVEEWGAIFSSPKPHNKRGCSDVLGFQISGTSLHIEASDTRSMQEEKNHKSNSHNSGNNAPASLEKGQN